jgi:hypothetical protein
MILQLMLSKAFAYDALYPVSVNSAGDLFFCYRKSQPGWTTGMLTHQYGEVAVGGTLRLTKDSSVIGSRQEPLTPREAPGKRNCQEASRARPFARRALMILRPDLVAMRARKPCVRTRLRLLG